MFHSYTGNCKYSNILKENCFTPPFLELTEDHINNKNIKSINDFILKDILKTEIFYVKKIYVYLIMLGVYKLLNIEF